MKRGHGLYIYVSYFFKILSSNTNISHPKGALLTNYWENEIKNGEHEKRENINTWVSWVYSLTL